MRIILFLWALVSYCYAQQPIITSVTQVLIDDRNPQGLLMNNRMVVHTNNDSLHILNQQTNVMWSYRVRKYKLVGDTYYVMVLEQGVEFVLQYEGQPIDTPLVGAMLIQPGKRTVYIYNDKNSKL